MSRPEDRDDRRRDDRPKPTALVVQPRDVGLPDEPFDNRSRVEDVRSTLLEARNRVNVVGPVTQIDRIPPGYVLSLRLVQFPLEGVVEYDRSGRPRILSGKYVDNGLWHKLPGGQDKPDRLALMKPALDQIAGLTGATFTRPERTDDGAHPYLWRYRVGIRYRGFDGQWREVWDEVEYDLRESSDGKNKSPEAAKAGRGLSEARRFGARLCISKARNRAIRAAFGLRPLVPEDAAKPFLFPVLQFLPDMTNPHVAAMVTAKELGIVEDVFGPGTSLGSRARAERLDPIDVTDPADDQELRRLPDPDADPSTWERPEEREREPVRREDSPRRARRRDDDGDPWDRERPRYDDRDRDRGRDRYDDDRDDRRRR